MKTGLNHAVRVTVAALSIVLGLITAMPCLAQDGAPDPNARMTEPLGALAGQMPANNASGFKDGEKDAASVAKGQAAFDAMVKAFRDAPWMTDTFSYTVKTPMGEQKDSFDVVVGPEGSMQIKNEQMEFYAVDGKLNMIVPTNEKKYLSLPIDGSVAKTLSGMGMELPMPHVKLRDASVPSMSAMKLMVLEEPKIAGYRSGAAGNEILLTDERGDVLLVTDAKTNLPSSMKLVFSPEGAPPGFTVGIDFAMAPKVVEKGTVAFSAGARKAVSSMGELETMVGTGDAAPAFSLKDLEGKSVELASFKGRVVVIDFWATWCGPCRKGLPLIDKVAKWAAEKKLPVTVLGINTWEEQGPDDAEESVLAKAKDFWTKQAFTFPSLRDMGGAYIKQYGFNGIPATVVIGPDGTIAQIHSGFAPTLDADLQKEIEALLAKRFQAVTVGFKSTGINQPDWFDVIEREVDASVVTNAELRAAIRASGLPWRVRHRKTGIEMILVPAGTFDMGASPGDEFAEGSESPSHTATIRQPFYLSRYEVTQQQYTARTKENPSSFTKVQAPSLERLVADGKSASEAKAAIRKWKAPAPALDARGREWPVENVTWEDARDFCRSAGLRLPTEAEWEFACRAGERASRYGPIREIAWFEDNAGGGVPSGGFGDSGGRTGGESGGNENGGGFGGGGSGGFGGGGGGECEHGKAPYLCKKCRTDNIVCEHGKYRASCKFCNGTASPSDTPPPTVRHVTGAGIDVPDRGTQAVGLKRGNALGLHDMIGNVSEWVQDQLRAYPSTSKSSTSESKGQAPNVARGGCCETAAHRCTASARYLDSAQTRIGLRVARDP